MQKYVTMALQDHAFMFMIIYSVLIKMSSLDIVCTTCRPDNTFCHLGAHLKESEALLIYTDIMINRICSDKSGDVICWIHTLN